MELTVGGAEFGHLYTPEQPTMPSLEVSEGGLQQTVFDSAIRVRLARELREENTEASIARAKELDDINDTIAFTLELVFPSQDGITWQNLINDRANQVS